MLTSNISERDAGIIQYHLECLLKLDHEINYLYGSAFLCLSELLKDITEHRNFISIKIQ